MEVELTEDGDPSVAAQVYEDVLGVELTDEDGKGVGAMDE
jgi:hypothetical protein